MKTQDSPESLKPVEKVCFGKFFSPASSITVVEKKIIRRETKPLGGNILLIYLQPVSFIFVLLLFISVVTTAVSG